MPVERLFQSEPLGGAPRHASALSFGAIEMKKRLSLGFVLVMAVAAVLSWHHWQSGRVMARSRNADRRFFNEIVVREMPTRQNPIWMLLRYDRYDYRCEFHTPMGGDRPWSLQTYTGDSFSASKARVEWTNDHEATVYLDDYPVLQCVDGWWSRPQQRDGTPNKEPKATP